MTRLTLVCHAATEALRAARFPDDETPDVAAAAPAARSIAAASWLVGPERRTTITGIALAGDRTTTVDPELRDWDCGRWRGLDVATLSRSEPLALDAWFSDPDAAPHGGESLNDLLGRVGHWLDLRAICGVRMAAVTHPAVIRAAIVKVIDAGPSTFWRIDVGPLCRAQFGHDGRRWVLQALIPPSRGA